MGLRSREVARARPCGDEAARFSGRGRMNKERVGGREWAGSHRGDGKAVPSGEGDVGSALGRCRRFGFGALVGGVLTLLGCSGGEAPREQNVPTGGACPAEGPLEIPLDAWCANGGCSSYEEAKQHRDASGTVDLCFDDSRWWYAEQRGCGRIEVSHGLGGSRRWVYDETSLQLVGFTSSDDVPFGPCNTGTYRAGAVEHCSEGTVCSLCDDSGKMCAPACSLEVLAKAWLGLPDYMVTAETYDCRVAKFAAQPELHLGCGRARVIGPDGAETSFTLGAHTVLSVSQPGDPSCPQGWGEPQADCDNETVCSLCQDDPNACTPELLAAE